MVSEKQEVLDLAIDILRHSMPLDEEEKERIAKAIQMLEHLRGLFNIE